MNDNKSEMNDKNLEENQVEINEIDVQGSKEVTKLTFTQKLKKMLPLFKFLGIFAGIIILYYYLISILNKGFFDSYVSFVAYLSALGLDILGNNAASFGTIIFTPKYSLSLAFGCEGSEPMVIFLAALIAFPMKIKYKLPGFVAGMLILFFMNLIRIIALYYIGLKTPENFELFHIQIFPIIFIFFAILVWIFWIKWATKKLTTS